MKDRRLGLVAVMLLISGLRTSLPVVEAAGPPSGSTAPGLKGRITGLTVTQSPTSATAMIDMIVQGQGRCSLDFDPGDGTRRQGIASAVLPLRVPYQFAQGGTFTITARATGTDCQGQATMTLIVLGLGNIVVAGVPTALHPLPITVEGAGTCGAIVLDFGDASPPETLNGSLPLRTTHIYKHGGSFRMVAQTRGGSTCRPTQVDYTLKVTGPAVVALPHCSAVGGEPLALEQYQNLTHPSPVLEPGDTVRVVGKSLGTTPGQLGLGGNFPGGVLQLVTSAKDWGDRAVVATVPKITGVVDQQANLEVVTKNGCRSNALTAAFRATREERQLESVEHLVALVSCSPSGSEFNSCDSTHPSGAHGSAVSTGASGSDVYRTGTLQNGWVFKRYEFRQRVNTGDTPGGFTPGSTRLDRLTISWEYAPGLLAKSEYDLWLIIEGPVGVPIH